jgi:hypothetical protein
LLRPSDLLTAFAAAGLTIAPVGERALLLIGLVVSDVAIALLIAQRISARRAKPEPVPALVVVQGDVPVRLRRRTEPGLRSRRPSGVIEMQERWRRAAENYRRARRDA